MNARPTTIRELRDTGYQHRSLRDELRANLVRKLRSGERLFSELHGYEDTVVPQVTNAILAGHDLLLLGERGQAKSRLARSLTSLLDEWVPVLAGSEVNDDPFDPVSAWGRSLVLELGQNAPVSWRNRDDRFAEKLATPDTSIADLIGEVDPIKIAEGRYLSNEEIISFGLIPRTNRGIFNLNELPDLSERIQVGLLNILEERDVQIRGFTVRLPLDVLVVASANPEDYTNRGRIITPLKDRFGSQIRTHYPATIAQEIAIVEQESVRADVEGVCTFVPRYMDELVAEISHVARAHPHISSRSGVSVRMSISNHEAMIANALRRSIVAGDNIVVPGILDIPAMLPAMMGKLEFDTWESDDESRVVDEILATSIRRVGAGLAQESWVDQLEASLNGGARYAFTAESSASSTLSALHLSADVFAGASAYAGRDEPAAILSAIGFALEYLHRCGRIERTAHGFVSLP